MLNLLEKWRSWRDDKRRTAQARELQQRGEQLFAAGNPREAIDILKQAVELAGATDAPHPSLYGAKGAVLLAAKMTLAYAGEKVGDRTLALDSIRDARALLALVRRADSWQPDDAVVKWEGWAQAYADPPL